MFNENKHKVSLEHLALIRKMFKHICAEGKEKPDANDAFVEAEH